MAGVKIDGNGFIWLQMFATDKTIKFLPLNNSGNECLAKVSLVQPNKKDLDLGQTLVLMGFALAAPLPKEIDVGGNIQSYYKQLKSSELKAKKSRRGQWSQLAESWPSWYLRNSLDKMWFHLKANLNTAERKLPGLSR